MTWRALLAVSLAAGAVGSTASPGPAPAASTPAADSRGVEIVPGPNGHLRVTEIGHPPLGMAGARARAAARENARGRARGRLLKAILALPLRNGRKVEDMLRELPGHRAGLRRIVNDAHTSGVELAGDAVEITLTVKMDGEGGLARYLDTLKTGSPRGP